MAELIVFVFFLFCSIYVSTLNILLCVCVQPPLVEGTLLYLLL